MKNLNINKAKVFDGVNLSDKDLMLADSKFKAISLRKGALLLQQAEVVKYLYYVVDGCLRTYYIDDNNKEHTLQFGIKDWWVTDYTAYYTSSKALLNIECLKDVKLLRIARLDMEFLYKEIPAIETFVRVKVESAFSSVHLRVLRSLSQSAKERYVSFVETYPNIEKSVKNYHIASYLGITTESLSRIRKEIAIN